MGFIRAILDASIVVQEERDEAAAKGKAEGKAEGRAEEARKFLRRLLKKSFPELESMPEIDGISNVETLEVLGENILDADRADQVRAAILAAAKPN